MATSRKSTRSRGSCTLGFALNVHPQCPGCGSPIPTTGWKVIHNVLVCPTCHARDIREYADLHNGICHYDTVDADGGPMTAVQHAALLVHKDHFRGHRLLTPFGFAFAPKQDWLWGKNAVQVLDIDQPGPYVV
jgi:hypothetical protein